MATVHDIIRSFEKWAPEATAESWDNVGLQVGSPTDAVTCGLVALDLTPDVIEEAVKVGADLVVTHHPPIFRPIRSLRSDDLVGSMLVRLAREGIALYVAHTNLDAARGGVSFALAEALGLRDVGFLSPAEGQTVKLVTFVPEDGAEAVYSALKDARAGSIGLYTGCAFLTEGTGRFEVPSVASPAIGMPGSHERVTEVRVEMEVERSRLGAALAALRSSHPYEEVAFDVVPLENRSTQTGMGAVGELADPLPLEEFVRTVGARLESPGVQYSGVGGSVVTRVAVCGGSGSSLIPAALNAGADAFVTGDVTYHRHFETMGRDGSAAMAVLDAGHAPSELPVLPVVAERMALAHKDMRWSVARSTSPVRGMSRPDGR